MIVNRYISEPLDSTSFPNAPNPNSNVIKKLVVEELELALLKNPIALGLSPIVAISYALVAMNKEGEYIYAVSVESLDLREMSNLIGVSVKQLQQEEGVKGFFTKPHIVMYGDGKKEDLGIYPKAIGEDTILEDLLEYAFDSLDILEEPTEVING